MSKPRCVKCAAAAQPPLPAPMMAMVLIVRTASAYSVFRDLRLVDLDAEAGPVRDVEDSLVEAKRRLDQVVEIFVTRDLGHDRLRCRSHRDRAGQHDFG